MSKYNEKIEDSMRIQRSMIVFEHAINSEQTKKQYYYWLNRFLKFCKIQDYDSLLTLSPNKLQTLVEDYVFYLKKTLQPSSVSNSLSSLQCFFAVNDVILNWVKIKRFLPKQEAKPSGKRAYTNQEVKDLLDRTSKPNHRALILVMASSGVRPQFVEDLRLKHLKKMSHDCLAMTVHSDTVYEYTTFINPEANQALDKSFEDRKKHGENVNQESLVFVSFCGKALKTMSFT